MPTTPTPDNPRGYVLYPQNETVPKSGVDAIVKEISEDVQEIVESGGGGGDLILNLTGAPAVIVLSASQSIKGRIYTAGTQSQNHTLEFPTGTARTWILSDEATRGGWTLSIRKTGGASTLVGVGEILRVRVAG